MMLSYCYVDSEYYLKLFEKLTVKTSVLVTEKNRHPVSAKSSDVT